MKSQARIIIEDFFAGWPSKVTHQEIAEMTGVPLDEVKRQVSKLVGLHLLQHQRAGHHTLYFKPQSAPKQKEYVSKLEGIYLGEELRPFDGRPGAMDAFACPSLRNGVREAYNPPKPILVGKPKESVSQGRD